ncbi:hypothetical protein BH11PSE11_BH11PSE11_03080 [soil metagenome]
MHQAACLNFPILVYEQFFARLAHPDVNDKFCVVLTRLGAFLIAPSILSPSNPDERVPAHRRPEPQGG